MKIIRGFSDYIVDIIVENIKSGDLPIVFSDNIKLIFNNMLEHPITKELLKYENNYSKYTLVDISKEEGKVSVSDSGKVIDYLSKLLDDDGVTVDDFLIQKNTSEKIWKTARNNIKIGKLIKKLFDDRFSESGKRGEDIQSFVDLYKSNFDILFNKKIDLFDIVEGDELVKWYDFDNYAISILSTPLHSSCMSDDFCSEYLEFYAKNSDKIKMLIQYSDETKSSITARSLLWFLDEPKGRVYMDRVYYMKDHQVDMFINYAKQNGWLFRESQNILDRNIIDSTTESLYRPNLIINNIKLSRYYPYLDTIRYLYQDNKILTNKRIGSIEEEPVLLTDTDGDVYSATWSTYYDKWISDDDVNYVMCDVLNKIYPELRLREDAIYLEYYDKYLEKNKYEKNKNILIMTTYGVKFLVLRKDAVWLNYYNEWTTKDYAHNNMVWIDEHDSYISKSDMKN